MTRIAGLVAGGCWLLASSFAWAAPVTITVTGTVDDPEATVEVNGIPATVVAGGFSADVTLVEGPNTITATATDPAENTSSHSVTVTLDTVPPTVTITYPSDGQLFGSP